MLNECAAALGKSDLVRRNKPTDVCRIKIENFNIITRFQITIVRHVGSQRGGKVAAGDTGQQKQNSLLRIAAPYGGADHGEGARIVDRSTYWCLEGAWAGSQSRSGHQPAVNQV